MIFIEDKGQNFGKWDDSTSQFLYHDSTKEILSQFKIEGKIADFGGANGNLKEFLPSSISIDIDGSKNPDIEDDIITHSEKYDWVIIRYVLHYLDDYQVLQLFDNIRAEKILIIQFTNENLKNKYYNSRNEKKYFRTRNQLEALLPDRASRFYRSMFNCTKEFYQNRLGFEGGFEHIETLNAYIINNTI